MADDDELARLKGEFEATGNGHYALAAWRYCRAVGSEIPEWVSGYIDFFAQAETDLQAEPPAADFVRAIGAATGIRFIKRSRRSQKAVEAAREVREARNRGDKSATTLWAAVAYRVGERTIKKALAELFPLFRINVRTTTAVRGDVLDADGKRRATIHADDGEVKSKCKKAPSKLAP